MGYCRTSLNDRVPDINAICKPDGVRKKMEHFDFYEETKARTVDEFIIREATKLYSELGSDDYETKIRILALLKNVESYGERKGWY